MSSLDDALHNLNRKALLAAETESDHAERVRDEIADVDRMHPGSDRGWRDEHKRELQKKVEGHDHRSKVWRRRAAHAAEGFLLMSQDEHSDPDFMTQHSNLISTAHTHGRVRHAEPLGED
jgi:hypothetical protein